MMTCTSSGDPHISTFSGHECDMHGRGFHPLVDLPELQVQAFHCPALTSDAAVNSAVSLRVGNHSLTIADTAIHYSGPANRTGNATLVTPLQHGTPHEFGRFRVTVSTSGNPWIRAAGYELFVVHVYIHGMSTATLTSKTFPRLPRDRFPQGRWHGFRTRTIRVRVRPYAARLFSQLMCSQHCGLRACRLPTKPHRERARAAD